MYSVVLAAMLTAGSAAPGHGWHTYSGCYGCWGCHGCYGCCGGCYGCCGGCYGCCGGCWGCCGGCYGCCGGCYSCCGGCWGGYSCYSAWGCYGCFANWACCGGVAYPAAAYTVPGAAPAGAPGMVPGAPPVGPATPPEKLRKPATEGTMQPSPARLIVALPPQAELFIDGQRSRSQETTREIVTPALAPGQDYFYELRAEVTRDGRKVSDQKRVLLRAGKVTHIDFGDLRSATHTASR